MPPVWKTRFSLFGSTSFLFFLAIRIASSAANQMLAVAAGWKIYDLTGSAFDLGMVGLVQFLPPITLVLFSGHLADHVDRRLILRCCYGVEIGVALGLAFSSTIASVPVSGFYALLFCNAIARTFEGPSLQSLLPELVSRDVLGRAVAASSMGNRIASLLGPPLGGFLYALGASADFLACAVLVSFAFLLCSGLPRRTAGTKTTVERSWSSLFAGMRFIWRTKPMLGAMSLDVIATLFGGVTALLPIFARDILHIGPIGLGVLRSAPALGSVVTASLLSRYPMGRRGGWFIFIGMCAYGVGTILFALSSYAAVSLLLLFAIGMGDMLSGVTRQTLIQVLAPPDIRGRVLAVNSLVNDTAGQLGMFESGVTTEWLGVEGSVIFGGVAVLLVTGAWIFLFPALHRIDWKQQIVDRRNA